MSSALEVLLWLRVRTQVRLSTKQHWGDKRVPNFQYVPVRNILWGNTATPIALISD